VRDRNSAYVVLMLVFFPPPATLPSARIAVSSPTACRNVQGHRSAPLDPGNLLPIFRQVPRDLLATNGELSRASVCGCTTTAGPTKVEYTHPMTMAWA